MSLPETETMVPRPVWVRALRRMEGLPLYPPTESEVQDAIKVLRDAASYERLELIFEGAARKFGLGEIRNDLRSRLEPLVEEAERIHQECTEEE